VFRRTRLEAFERTSGAAVEEAWIAQRGAYCLSAPNLFPDTSLTRTDVGKQAVSKMVQEAISFIDKTDDMTIKLELIETLRTITEGKIYVEVERARLTRTLSKIKEDEGKIDEAAEILQELQVGR
jgi:hypothetical protein